MRVELAEALRLSKQEMEEKIKRAKAVALKKKLFVIAVVIIVFVVSFFIFFKHREVEMTFEQAKILEMLLPWGYTLEYRPAGIAIIENFGDAIFWSILISLEFGMLACLLAFLLAYLTGKE